MKTPLFLILTSLITFLPVEVQAQTDESGELIRINMNKMCAKVVNIPYASDNFSDEEFKKFLECKEFVQSFAE